MDLLRSSDKLERLRGQEGYPKWAHLMETHFMKIKVWEVVEGNEREPEASRVVAREEWREKNLQALLEMRGTVDENVGYHIKGIKNANEAWTTLKGRYTLSGAATVTALTKQLHQLSLQSSSGITPFLDKFEEVVLQLTVAGSCPSDEALGNLMLGAINDKKVEFAGIHGKYEVDRANKDSYLAITSALRRKNNVTRISGTSGEETRVLFGGKKEKEKKEGEKKEGKG